MARLRHAERTLFLEQLSRTGSVTRACAETGVSRAQIYREASHNLAFRCNWDTAVADAHELLRAEAVRRAVDGVPLPPRSRTPVAVDADGNRAPRRRYSDSLLIYLIQSADEIARFRRQALLGDDARAERARQAELRREREAQERARLERQRFEAEWRERARLEREAMERARQERQQAEAAAPELSLVAPTAVELPFDPAPADPEPVDPEPVDQAPVDPTPVETTLAAPTPAEPAPPRKFAFADGAVSLPADWTEAQPPEPNCRRLQSPGGRMQARFSTRHFTPPANPAQIIRGFVAQRRAAEQRANLDLALGEAVVRDEGGILSATWSGAATRPGAPHRHHLTRLLLRGGSLATLQLEATDSPPEPFQTIARHAAETVWVT